MSDTKPAIGSKGGQMEEQSIEWLEDPLSHKYLRESYATCASRVRWAKRNFLKDGRLVGYATLLPDAPSVANGVFRRRIWWLKAGSDPYESSFPGEAVVPESVCAGKESCEGRKP